MWLAVLGFMVMRLVSGLSLTNHLDSRSFLVVHALFSQDGCVRGVCNFLGSVSSQPKFEAMDVKALGVSELSDSFTAQFYLENKGKHILKA